MFTSTTADRWSEAEASARARAPDAYSGRDRRRRQAATFDPVFIGRAVWRWRWLALFTGVLGLAFGIALASVTPRTYQAAAQVLLDPRDLKFIQNEVAPNALPSDATLALIESQTAVVLSNSVLSGVVEEARLADDPEFNGRAKHGLAALLPRAFALYLPRPKMLSAGERSAFVLDALRKALTVEREPKSFIIVVSAKTENAEKSARIANLVSQAFIAELGSIQSDTARRATLALTSRLTELRHSVGAAEQRVENYKAKNALIGVNGRLVDDAYITRVNDGLARARADMAALGVKAQSLKAASIDDIVAGAFPEEMTSEALTRLRQTHADLAQQRGSLAATLGPRHPQRIAVEGALAAARQSIRRELGRIVAAAQTEFARAEATERDLTARLDGLKAKQIETSGSFVRLRELERDVDASRAVYEAFLLRARETSEQESLNTANIRVVTDATAPLQSSGTSRRTIVMASTLAGVLFGVMLVAALATLRLLIGLLRDDRRSQPMAERIDPVAQAPAPPATGEQWAGDVSSPAESLVSAGEAAGSGRSILRERVRALSEAGPAEDAVSAETLAANRDLQSVRETLAAIQRRRSGLG